jgi:hypothetical protein
MELVGAAAAVGILIEPLADPSRPDVFCMGVTSLPKSHIREGVERLARIVRRDPRLGSRELRDENAPMLTGKGLHRAMAGTTQRGVACRYSSDRAAPRASPGRPNRGSEGQLTAQRPLCKRKPPPHAVAHSRGRFVMHDDGACDPISRDSSGELFHASFLRYFPLAGMTRGASKAPCIASISTLRSLHTHAGA